jgi:hypothetical protein
VLPDNGRHSLQSWDKVPAFGVRSPRVFLVTDDALEGWKVRARAALDAAEEDPSPVGGLVEIPSPAPRLDCGVALRIQRYGPTYWPYEYVDTLKVVEATSGTCDVELVPPDLPSRLAGLSTFELCLGGGSLLIGGFFMLWSTRQREEEPVSEGVIEADTAPIVVAGKPSARRPTQRKPPVRRPSRPRGPPDNDVESASGKPPRGKRPRGKDGGPPKRRR